MVDHDDRQRRVVARGQRGQSDVRSGGLTRRRLLVQFATGLALTTLTACTRSANVATPTIPPTLAVTIATPAAATPTPDLWAALGERIEAGMRRLQVPGVAVGVLTGGQEQLAGFGMTTEATARPVDPDVPFMLGSTSKVYTGTTIMRLIEEGKLSLDTPVRTFLPDLRLADEAVAQRLTLRHLVTHTGGWWGDFDTSTGDGDDALARYVGKLDALPQVAPLGQFFGYSNAGMRLAGRAIEVVTGLTYEAAMQELIFAPLALTNTSFARPTRAVVARPLERNQNPSGGIASSIRDLLRWARFHLGDGTLDGARLLRPASLNLMQSPLGPDGSIGTLALEGVGVNWLLRRLGGARVVQHDGGVPGYVSTLILVPARQFAIALVANAETAFTLLSEVTTWALEAYLGLVVPVIAPADLAPDQLALYAGRYAVPGYAEIAAQQAEGKLLLTFARPPGARPATIAFYAPDRTATTGEAGQGSLVDFLRRPDGTVGWLRYSGRLLARQPG